ncbi:MAG TPA: hypothetical protein DCL73_08780 [Treponema sp.]|nr:hypothetical protein [Treponema sp.]
MTYPETLYTALASAATGGAAFCALSVFAAAVFHRPCRKWRLSAFCVLLSIAVASFTFLLIFTSFTIEHLQLRSAAVWCAAFSAAGFLCAAFYRILIPAVFAAYIVLSLFTCHIMRVQYPVRRNPVPVSVSDGSFSSGSVTAPLFPDKNGSSCILLDVCTLPPELILPLPRTWYAFHESPAGTAGPPEKGNALRDAAERYASYAAGSVTVMYIPVTAGADTAALYMLDFSSVPPVLIRVL